MLELSTVEGHPSYFWNFDEASPFDDQFKNVNVRYEEDTHFVVSRFSPKNNFHAIHDYIIGLYFLIKEYKGLNEMDNSIGDDHRILFFDQHGSVLTDELYQHLTKKTIRHQSYLSENQDTVTCFKDAIFGNSKVTTVHIVVRDRSPLIFFPPFSIVLSTARLALGISPVSKFLRAQSKTKISMAILSAKWLNFICKSTGLIWSRTSFSLIL